MQSSKGSTAKKTFNSDLESAHIIMNSMFYKDQALKNGKKKSQETKKQHPYAFIN